MVSGGGHHGGAWKVAYADFVTAMMAFFLMLWLLGSVEDDKRKGVADYFSDTFAVQSHSSGSEGIMGGAALSVVTSVTDEIATREKYRADVEALELIIEIIESRIAQDEVLGDAFEHVTIRMTDEGLLVELFDLDNAPLFEAADNQPRPVLRLLTEVIADVFATVTNPLAIQAHSRSFPTVFLENPVWSMTIERAQVVQNLMRGSGLPDERVHRVTGNADRVPFTSPPTAARNNRIELVLLTQQAEP